MLRRRRIWPCFEGTGINIAERGCKTIGYWEKQQQHQTNSNIETRKINEKVRKRKLNDDFQFYFPSVLLQSEKRRAVYNQPTRAKKL